MHERLRERPTPTSDVDIEGLHGYALALQPDGKIVVVGIVNREKSQLTTPARRLSFECCWTDSSTPSSGSRASLGTPTHPLTGFPSDVAALPGGGAAISGYTNLGSAYRQAGWLTALVTPDGQWKALPGGPRSYADLYTEWGRPPRSPFRRTASCSSEASVPAEPSSPGSRRRSELDAGPPLTLAVESTDRQFARGTVRRGVAHLTGAVEASDDARVTVSVQRVNPKRPCIARATLALRPGTSLGTTRRTRPGTLVTSQVQGRARTLFDAAFSLDKLKRGESYTLNIWVSDDRSRYDVARVRFTRANTALRIDPDLLRCPPKPTQYLRLAVLPTDVVNAADGWPVSE